MRYNPTFSPLSLPRDHPRRSPACKQTSFPTTATKPPAFLAHNIPIESFNIRNPGPFHSSSALRSRPITQLNSGSTCLDPTLYCLLPHCPVVFLADPNPLCTFPVDQQMAHRLHKVKAYERRPHHRHPPAHWPDKQISGWLLAGWQHSCTNSGLPV